MSLIPVARNDVAIGVPLPWPIFDQGGNKLMEQGRVLDTPEQLDVLLTGKPLRELSWQSRAADSGAEGSVAANKYLDEALAAGKASGFEFRDMRLRIGDRIQVQLPASVSAERFIVKLIGYVDKVSLLVTAPVENGLRLPLQDNDKIVARVFSSQKAFGFGCSVGRVCKTPFDYLHLSFPERIQGTVVRSSPRVRTNIIASIAKSATDGGDERQAGVIAKASLPDAEDRRFVVVEREDRRARIV